MTYTGKRDLLSGKFSNIHFQKYGTQTLHRHSQGNRRTSVPESLFYLMLRDAMKLSLFLL